jgi:cyclic pyranopterin phosphate synthase
MEPWNHFDDDGRPRMVDVGGKAETWREAEAEGWIDLPGTILEALQGEGVPKGDPFRIAEIAGIQGAKRTPDLIPLCHPIRLVGVDLRCDLVPERSAVRVRCVARAREITGVEMEALTGVSMACLAFYDMCKGLDKGMKIRSIRLLRKSGGKSGDWKTEEAMPCD